MVASGMPLVLVEKMEPGLRCFNTLSIRARLISRFSVTASTIQSQPLILARSSSKLPGVTSDLVSGVKKAAGFCFRAASNPPREAALRLAWLGRTISSNKAGMPALAKWAAMRDPMVPAPSTATRRSGVINRSVPHFWGSVLRLSTLKVFRDYVGQSGADIFFWLWMRHDAFHPLFIVVPRI